MHSSLGPDTGDLLTIFLEHFDLKINPQLIQDNLFEVGWGVVGFGVEEGGFVLEVGHRYFGHAHAVFLHWLVGLELRLLQGLGVREYFYLTKAYGPYIAFGF